MPSNSDLLFEIELVSLSLSDKNAARMTVEAENLENSRKNREAEASARVQALEEAKVKKAEAANRMKEKLANKASKGKGGGKAKSDKAADNAKAADKATDKAKAK